MNFFKIVLSLVFIGISVGSLSCGTSTSSVTPTSANQTYPGWNPWNDPNSWDGQGSCPSGTFLWGGYCVQPSNMQNQCAQVGGTLISSGQLCKRTYSTGSMQLWQYLPVLTPSQPNSFSALNTGIYLMSGDRVSYYGSGAWGGLEQKTYKGLIFKWNSFHFDCDDVGIDGYKGGEYVYHQGYKAGLLGYTGAQFIELGKSKNFTANHSGLLKVGLNTSTQNGLCGNISISISRSRCILEDGSTQTCPF